MTLESSRNWKWDEASKTNEEPLILYEHDADKVFLKEFKEFKTKHAFGIGHGLHKPVNRFDLFLMKIQEAFQQAFQDFQPGRMGIIRWYGSEWTSGGPRLKP